MYLSKVSLLNSVQAKSTLLDLGKNGAYAAHQLLWRLFTDDVQRNFLFKQEQSNSGSPVFYVLSKQSPQLLPELFDIEIKLFTPQIQVGDRFAYKLTVNPTVCIKNNAGKSKRHDVLMNAKRQAKKDNITDSKVIRKLMTQAAQEWFVNEHRTEGWGTQFDTLPDIESYSQHSVVKKKNNNIQFSSVDVQGTLTVQDSEKFITQLFKGFGRSKAMGCGLMMIRRI